MIEVSNISKTYAESEKKAVDKISFTLQDGKIYGLLGPNGAGKTTTLKMMTGILKPDEGDVILEGYSIQDQPLEAKSSFAFVMDEPNAFLRLTGLEYLGFMADIYGVSEEERNKSIDELSREFGMTDALNNKISSYSHGMRQKIFLIAALMQNPPIWILDEPMTGLDPRSSFILKERMRQHADDGNVVLFSTHVLDVAEKVCDVIIIINEGRIIQQGSMEELRSNISEGDSLESIFLELTDMDGNFSSASWANETVTEEGKQGGLYD